MKYVEKTVPKKTLSPDVDCVRYVRGFAYQNHINEDGENRQQTHYFHCDQIDIPHEMTDIYCNLLWYGEYIVWGRLKKDERVYQHAHQPFRLQDQYCGRERDCITTFSGIMSLMRFGL